MKSILARGHVAHAASQRGLACAGLSLGFIAACTLMHTVPSAPLINRLKPMAHNIEGTRTTLSASTVNLSVDGMTAGTGPKSVFRPTLAATFERPDRGHSAQPLFSRNGVIFVSAAARTVWDHTIFKPYATRKTGRSNGRQKRGPILAALQEQPPFLRMTRPSDVFTMPSETHAVESLPLADAIAALEALPTQVSFDRKPATSPTSADTTNAENRRAATLGIAPDSLRYDDRPGRLSSAAEAGVWNGQPAAAVGLGYTLPSGQARVNATGVSSGQKTFGITAVASIALP